MRQFYALLKLHKRAIDRENERFGTLAAVTANFSMNRDSKQPPLKPSDFFKLPEAEPERMSGDQIFGVLRSIHESRQKAGKPPK